MSIAVQPQQLAAWRVTTPLPPIPGESGDGYGARVAAAEFIPRLFDLTSMAGASFTHRAALSQLDGKGVRIIADCLGIEANDLAERCMRHGEEPRRTAFFGSHIDRQHVAPTTRRFAPASLLISPHHRALWKLRPFPFCEETWQLLTDTCPNDACATVQRWRWTGGIDLCDRCGEPLTRANVEDVPAHLRDTLAQAIGTIHPDPERRAASSAALPSDLAALGPAALLDLLCAVAGVVDPSIRFPVGKRLISPKAGAPRVAEAVAGAWTVLAGWPSAFESLAAKRLSTRQGRFGDGNGEATVDFLELPSRCRLDPSVEVVIRELAAGLASNASAGYSPRDAASRSGATSSALVKARRDGFIPTVFHLADRGPVPLLERNAVDALAGDARVLHHHAAAELGVTSRAVEEMVRLGILNPAQAAPGRSGEGIARSSLDTLRRRVEANACQIADGIPLDAAMRGTGGRLKPWASAFGALLDGTLHYWLADGADCVTGRIVVAREAVALLRTLPDLPVDPADPYERNMSKGDAADALNLQPNAFSFLAEWPSSNGWARTVPTEWVEAAARRHISAAEISIRLGMASVSVRALMRAEGIGRLSEAGYDRQAFDLAFACIEHDAPAQGIGLQGSWRQPSSEKDGEGMKTKRHPGDARPRGAREPAA